MWVPNSERGHKMSSLEGEMKSPTSPFVNEVFFGKKNCAAGRCKTWFYLFLQTHNKGLFLVVS